MTIFYKSLFNLFWFISSQNNPSLTVMKQSFVHVNFDLVLFQLNIFLSKHNVDWKIFVWIVIEP